MAYISQIKLGPTTYDISAYKLKNARTINLTGAITGSASFDGTTDISINTALSGSHTHDQYLPLTAGRDKKLTGPLGLTENINYGPDLPTNTFDGQLFFLEDSGSTLPPGGAEGQVLVKASSLDNDATWQTLTVSNNFNAGTTSGPSIQTTVGNYTSPAVEIPAASDSASGIVTTSDQTFAGAKTFNSTINTGIITVRAQDSTHEGGEIILSPAISSFKTGHIDMYDNRIRYHDGTTEYFVVDLSSGDVRAVRLYGAVWNDYAEFRICNEEFKPGQVVLENGDDTLSIASQRLQRGCSIVSDTFGFAIGETDGAKCPIAVSGRVLAYGYESREEFKKHIGWPVCSGPNGTISIMTEEEEEKYPSRIIGTISAVPDYETWGTGNVEVNDRIWIKVK